MEAVVQTFLGVEKPRESFQEWIETWIDWECHKKDRTLILIGTDIGKGVVPVEEEARRYRDLVGWCFQDMVKKAMRVDVIWYGLNEQLKKGRSFK
ncbi:bifunctional adenosylcobinamide kinase/adenosylcobinamide-phosphate guanylyltransferase [Alkalihalobacillus deserti]|uniref:bifunctional adenosylcobinamide kinase/adenosylcobinamide-phosphate guanylyltransferase n=1 Tax=Alkalihalobacillus deserti TaxID=2879466 RepID=UPI001D15673D|nr:bifunctional adenosylcobinamide kinase/adenosylcobinamide-phosphate guanylyltransferase [Alkalihalobacillus deserti]